jgi:hypothetical protein
MQHSWKINAYNWLELSKWLLEKQDERVWDEFMLLRTGPVAGCEFLDYLWDY